MLAYIFMTLLNLRIQLLVCLFSLWVCQWISSLPDGLFHLLGHCLQIQVNFSLFFKEKNTIMNVNQSYPTCRFWSFICKYLLMEISIYLRWCFCSSQACYHWPQCIFPYVFVLVLHSLIVFSLDLQELCTQEGAKFFFLWHKTSDFLVNYSSIQYYPQRFWVFYYFFIFCFEGARLSYQFSKSSLDFLKVFQNFSLDTGCFYTNFRPVLGAEFLRGFFVCLLSHISLHLLHLL